MTDHNETPDEAEETPTEAPEPETSDTEAEDTQEGQETPKEVREAQKYRKRAQAAEAERDQALELAGGLARTLVEHELSRFITGKDPGRLFWLISEEGPRDYLTAEGTVDVSKVREAAHKVRDDLGLPAPGYVPGTADTPDIDDLPGYRQGGVEDAFKPKSDRW